MANYSKLRRCGAARKALIRDLVTDLIINEKIETTEAKAKELRKLADRMITLGKENTLSSRRQAAKLVRFEHVQNEDGTQGKFALQKLFEELAPRYASRNGGYTRVIKTGFRRGDAAPLAIIEFVK